jgi:outer membrane protein W
MEHPKIVALSAIGMLVVAGVTTATLVSAQAAKPGDFLYPIIQAIQATGFPVGKNEMHYTTDNGVKVEIHWDTDNTIKAMHFETDNASFEFEKKHENNHENDEQDDTDNEEIEHINDIHTDNVHFEKAHDTNKQTFVTPTIKLEQHQNQGLHFGKEKEHKNKPTDNTGF